MGEMKKLRSGIIYNITSITIMVLILSCGPIYITDQSKVLFNNPDFYIYKNPSIAVLPVHSTTPKLESLIETGEQKLISALNESKRFKFVEPDEVKSKLNSLGKSDYIICAYRALEKNEMDSAQIVCLNEIASIFGVEFILCVCLKEYTSYLEKAILGAEQMIYVVEVEGAIWDSYYKEIEQIEQDTSKIGGGELEEIFNKENVLVEEDPSKRGTVVWRAKGKSQGSGSKDEPPPTFEQLVEVAMKGLVKKIP